MLHIIDGTDTHQWHVGEQPPPIQGRVVEFQASDDELAIILAAMKRTQTAELLTPRERQTLAMIAEGKVGKEIAHELGVSIKTAEAHRFNLFKKLGVHNKTD